MSAWLHYIGRAYYTRAQFIREAKAIGITRRLSRDVARRMAFGDVVYLAIKDGATPVVFGKFVVSTLSGLSADELEALARETRFRCVDIGGEQVERECGDYVAGPTFVADTPIGLKRMVELADGAEGEHGKLMIGGALVELEPPVRLGSVRKTSQGFRPFDADAFAAAIADPRSHGRRGLPTVRGHFYVGRDAEPSNVVYLDERRVQTVQRYQRGDRKR